MLTLQDFETKYEKYSDEELFSLIKNKDEYNEVAQEALDNVLAKKGGIDTIINRLEAKAVIEEEKKKLTKEITLLSRNGVDASFIKKTTHSAILSSQQLEDLIEINVLKAEAHVEDLKVNGDTISKSVIGFGLASLIGGAFASLQYLYLGATHILLIIGLALVCYAKVKLVTKKSYNNTAVLIASFLAFLFSNIIGYVALSIFGFLG
jgi:hypothetical protein